jgi:hypothetical protein
VAIPVVPGHANSWWVHAGNASGYSTETYGYFVCNAPDLTVTGYSIPSGVIIGTPFTYTATVKNIGTSNVGTTFPNLFILASTPGADVCDSVQTAPNLAPGASATLTSGSCTLSTPGTYYVLVSANTDWDWVIGNKPESNTSNNGPWSWQTFTVAAPDLTASTVSLPSAPTVNQSSTFSANIHNGGTTSTGTGFSNVFEIDNDATHDTFSQIYAVVAGTTFTTALAANGDRTESASYTFPSSGTWYVRACADKNTSNNGTITEADENNNCSSPWQALSVSALPTCAPASQTVDPGATASWTAAGGTGSYTWYDALNNNLGTGSSLSKTYSTSGNYAVHVQSGTQTSSNCNLTVSGDCGTTPSGTLSADRTRVKKGDTVILKWSNVKGVTSCSITGAPACAITTNATCDASGVSTCASPVITTQTEFTLTCNGTNVDSVIVDVLPNINET